MDVARMDRGDQSRGKNRSGPDEAALMRSLAREARGQRRADRAGRRANLLVGLEAGLFGHRMPHPEIVIAASGWKPEPPEASCARCGGSVVPFEALEGGCGECRGRPMPAGGCVRLGPYAPPLSQWVPAIKGRCWRSMGRRLGGDLGRSCADAIARGRIATPDVVASVPTHWLRRLVRGIDHAREIAEEVAQELRVPYAPLLCARLGGRQAGTDRTRRGGNVGRYSCRAGAEARKVLLVDDVRTTGTTLCDAARALRVAGARHVDVAVCAVADAPGRRRHRPSFAGHPTEPNCGSRPVDIF